MNSLKISETNLSESSVNHGSASMAITSDTAKREIQEACEIAFRRMVAIPGVQMLMAGKIEIKHYKAILREIYLYTKDTPQMLAALCAHLRGDQRESVKMMMKHAASEVGHHNLALKDLENLGEDVSMIPYRNPLPATMAVISYPYYQIQNLNPVGFLGFIQYLEFIPTVAGGGLMEQLKVIGVPENAMTFIDDHARIDIGHQKLTESYIRQCVRTRADLESVKYAVYVTAKLYGEMIEDAIKSADTQEHYAYDLAEMPVPVI